MINKIDLILQKSSQFELYCKKIQAAISLPHYKESPDWTFVDSGYGRFDNLRKSLKSLRDNIKNQKLKEWFSKHFLRSVVSRLEQLARQIGVSIYDSDVPEKIAESRNSAPEELKKLPEFNELMTRVTQLFMSHGSSLKEKAPVESYLEDPSNIQELEDRRRRMEIYNALKELEDNSPSVSVGDDPETQRMIEETMTKGYLQEDPLLWGEKKPNRLLSLFSRRKKDDFPYRPLPNWERMPSKLASQEEEGEEYQEEEEEEGEEYQDFDPELIDFLSSEEDEFYNTHQNDEQNVSYPLEQDPEYIRDSAIRRQKAKDRFELAAKWTASKSGSMEGFRRLKASMDPEAWDRHLDSIRSWLTFEIGLDVAKVIHPLLSRALKRGQDSDIAIENRLLKEEEEALLATAVAIGTWSEERLENFVRTRGASPKDLEELRKNIAYFSSGKD